MGKKCQNPVLSKPIPMCETRKGHFLFNLVNPGSGNSRRDIYISYLYIFQASKLGKNSAKEM